MQVNIPLNYYFTKRTVIYTHTRERERKRENYPHNFKLAARLLMFLTFSAKFMPSNSSTYVDLHYKLSIEERNGFSQLDIARDNVTVSKPCVILATCSYVLFCFQ